MRWGIDNITSLTPMQPASFYFVSIRILCAQPFSKDPIRTAATEMFRQYCDILSGERTAAGPEIRCAKTGYGKGPALLYPFVPGRVELNTADSAELVNYTESDLIMP